MSYYLGDSQGDSNHAAQEADSCGYGDKISTSNLRGAGCRKGPTEQQECLVYHELRFAVQRFVVNKGDPQSKS